MSYTVKEIFYTLQGEGAQSGRAAVFCRFSGCNLWSGREEDRSRAVCQFCDTDFVGVGADGGRFASANELAEAIDRCWIGRGAGRKYVVCTGGEPLLQLDEDLIEALHQRGFEVAVETNGTKPAPAYSTGFASARSRRALRANERERAEAGVPHEKAPPEKFAQLAFDHFFLQPMDGTETALKTSAPVEYCLAHPNWRLSTKPTRSSD